VLYLENEWISFTKASLLMNEAKNDPIKKADLIRAVSISKIPDRIQREIYIQNVPNHGYFRASCEYF
jgi:DNA primase